jgi:hypothetical protein
MIYAYGAPFSQAADEDTLLQAYWDGFPAITLEIEDDFTFTVTCGYTHSVNEPLCSRRIDVRDYAPGVVHVMRIPVFQRQRPWMTDDGEPGAASARSTNYRPDMWFTRFGILSLSRETNIKLEYLARMFGAAANTVSFYRKPGTEECAVFPRVLTRYAGCEPVILQNGNWMQDWMADFDANYQFHYEKAEAKLTAILNMDANESLAYMEAQLDFVTKMLVTIVESDPDVKLKILKQVQEYANFRAAFEERAVFTLKSESACIEEIRTGKGRVRSAQAAYYAAKEGGDNGSNQ